jgi:hypothetical protein
MGREVRPRWQETQRRTRPVEGEKALTWLWQTLTKRDLFSPRNHVTCSIYVSTRWMGCISSGITGILLNEAMISGKLGLLPTTTQLCTPERGMNSDSLSCVSVVMKWISLAGRPVATARCALSWGGLRRELMPAKGQGPRATGQGAANVLPRCQAWPGFFS